MTKRKASPQKRGRKPISDLARRSVLAHWERFNKENPRLPPEVRFQRFCTANKETLRSLRITVGEYQGLKNVLTRARKAKAARLTSLLQRDIQRKLYLQEATKFALGLPSHFRPLIDPN